MRAPSVEEMRALLRAARGLGARFHGFLWLIASTGMRRGEACALRWSDVDFDSRTVTVDESIVAATGGARVKAPKSRAGVRRLALDVAAIAALRALADETASIGSLARFALTPEHFVFASELPGVRPPHPDTMSAAFRRVRQLAGVADDLHLHSLRHFQATALDTVVSERQKQARLGWATVHIARHYTDGIAEEDRRAAEHIGRLLGAEASSAGTEPQTGQPPGRPTKR